MSLLPLVAIRSFPLPQKNCIAAITFDFGNIISIPEIDNSGFTYEIIDRYDLIIPIAHFIQKIAKIDMPLVISISKNGQIINLFDRLSRYFFNEFRFQPHLTNAWDFTIDVVITIHKADVFDLGADFHHRR